MPIEHVSSALSNDNTIDYHIITLLEKLETMRKEDSLTRKGIRKFNMHHELRTLEFWRSIISECLSSFFYVFIVCGAAAGAGIGASISSVLLATALAAGFSIAALTQCFFHVSGANINPAVSLALAVTRVISPMRAAMYITAQCGGGIAGAALLYSVTIPGYQGNLQAAVTHSASLAAWERFGVEFVLTFIVVLTYLVSTSPNKKFFGLPALTVGAAYAACSFVSMPYLNPARSLGPSFVLNKWDNHWVYWLGPMFGGFVSGVLYDYIFTTNPSKCKKSRSSSDNDSVSMTSDDEMNYDMEMEKTNPMHAKFHGSAYNTYRSGTAATLGPQGSFCEPIYGGTRSMYCRSPPLTRANLHRSQSVYAKSQSAVNRDLNRDMARSGQLVPAQSMYPFRLSSQPHSAHAQNQNVQNQLQNQHRSESIYGIRSSFRAPSSQQQQQQSSQQQQQTPAPPPLPQDRNTITMDRQMQQSQPENTSVGHAFQPLYSTRPNPTPTEQLVKYETRSEDSGKYRATRPDSVYGVTSTRGRGQSAQSDDSSYGSYQGSSLTPPNRVPSNSSYSHANGQVQMTNYGVQGSGMQMQNDRKCNGGNGAMHTRDLYGTVTGKQPHVSTNPNGAPMQQCNSYGMHQIRQN